MKFSSSFSAASAVLLASVQLVSAHFEVIYPGWRANTLHDDDQWIYPCGGAKVTTNRTLWPVSGGPIEVMPGWNSGHPTSFFYLNMNLGNDPKNFTFQMLPVFQIVGPSRDPFPGTFCLPQVPLPTNFTVKPGDNATIQVIQVALHGASLYNCADITFVADEDYKKPADVCLRNASTINFNAVYTTRSRSAGSLSLVVNLGSAALAAGLAAGAMLL